MTTQISEELINDHPRLSLGAWRVFGVIRGHPSQNHGWGDRTQRVYRAEPKQIEPSTTANWKGYRERWHLKADGALHLDAIIYDRAWENPPLVTNERLEGDFHLVVKSQFEGPRQYIPFEAGHLVLDESRWIHERYTGPSPSDTALAVGKHPDFPERALLWYELDFPPDTTRD